MACASAFPPRSHNLPADSTAMLRALSHSVERPAWLCPNQGAPVHYPSSRACPWMIHVAVGSKRIQTLRIGTGRNVPVPISADQKFVARDKVTGSREPKWNSGSTQLKEDLYAKKICGSRRLGSSARAVRLGRRG